MAVQESGAKPAPHKGLLLRPRLEALLAQGLEHSLVTLTAGLGYGKTQAVSAFAVRQKRLCWLHLSGLDNIPMRFWQNLVLSLRTGQPQLAGQLSALGFPHTMTKLDSFLRLLAAEIYGGEKLVLVVDDYSCIHNRQVQGLFHDLLEANLENFCLILLSSAPHDLSLACLKGGGSVYQINAAQLQFTPQETAELFLLHHTPLKQEQLEHLQSQTGGWPLALYLLALPGQAQPAPSRLPGLAPIDILFEQEYFANYDEDIRQLLIKLAALPGFSQEIVRLLTTGPLAATLAVLEQHMFIHYDAARGLYLLQPMFRSFLLRKQILLHEAEWRRVFSLAGDWFFMQNHLLEAVECYSRCNRWDDLLQVICRYPKDYMGTELVDFLLRYLRQLPGEFCAAHPLADYLQAALRLNNLELETAQNMLFTLEQRLTQRQDAEARETLGEVYLSLAAVAILRFEDNFLPYYRQAAAHLPEGSRVQQANQLILGSETMLFLADNQAGGLARVVQSYRQAAPYIERLFHGGGRGLDPLVGAEAAYLTLDLAEARAQAYQAIYQAQEKDQHDVVCHAHGRLAKIALLRGDYEEALRQVASVRDYADIYRLAPLFALRDRYASWLAISLGDSDRAAAWLHADGDLLPPQPPIYSSGDHLLYAAYLLQRGQYGHLLAYLDNLQGPFREPGLWLGHLQAGILRALACQKSGAEDEALAHLLAAYHFAQANAILSPFVEQGNGMRGLIELARKSAPRQFEAAWLDTVATKAASHGKRLAAMAHLHAAKHRPLQQAPALALSKREREVLQSLAQGLTQEEIADFFQLSLSTVKSHIRSIYNKLGAINRADAIHIANQRGLIA